VAAKLAAIVLATAPKKGAFGHRGRGGRGGRSGSQAACRGPCGSLP